MTDTVELKKAMLDGKMSQNAMADLLGITKQAVSYKVNGHRPFKSNEISKIAHVLKLSPERVMQIFFANNVDR